MSVDLSDDQSILVQVMAWCRQATSHYLSQCWPRSLSPYGFTRPQWVENKYRTRICCCELHKKQNIWWLNAKHIDGSVQTCSNSIANALELLQSCAKPSICNLIAITMLQLYREWYWIQRDIYNGKTYINGFVQDCSISIANALEILQSCTKPLISIVSICHKMYTWFCFD